MKETIKIVKTENSRLPHFDFDNMPPFGSTFTDHMFEADYIDGKWQNFTIKPLQNLSIHPSNLTFHYGQAIFEGMKASLRRKDGVPLLFRPLDHARRLNNSARRLSMPEFPEDWFVEVLEQLILVDKGWIPPEEGSAMYIRPFMIAMDNLIGVKPSQTYKFMILLLPVGPYYAKPVTLRAETKYVRAVKGGIGEAKAAGNYAASLFPFMEAKNAGYDQIMWLDALEFKYVQEIGTMNIFFVYGDKVVTPATDGALLKGITRDSFIKILKKEGIEVVERLISIDELIEAYKAGELTEVWGSGTAAVVANVSKLAIHDELLEFDVDNYRIGSMVKSILNKLRSGERKDEFGWIVPVEEKVEV
jgi:branched-chain amino acid aminotransferase